nr:MAG TPA: hypothetical protein [Caudoviricetes sp.]DAL38167.1 MAG TPA_asm: hypothetical protein [Bacteriophage sp.]DAQ76467.1 MAG TPA: hypothetical protein [Bacteriophage sp.]DAU75992.1 MAG TPA: hypothetical protein [Bacteriophage sp.]DAY81287.1 MAG TPA: hypothetical protein [Caudoviricetes sp.]
MKSLSCIYITISIGKRFIKKGGQNETLIDY